MTDTSSRVLLRALIGRYRDNEDSGPRGTDDWNVAFHAGYREGIATAIAVMAGVYDMPDVEWAGRDAWYAALENAVGLDR